MKYTIAVGVWMIGFFIAGLIVGPDANFIWGAIFTLAWTGIMAMAINSRGKKKKDNNDDAKIIIM